MFFYSSAVPHLVNMGLIFIIRIFLLQQKMEPNVIDQEDFILFKDQGNFK